MRRLVYQGTILHNVVRLFCDTKLSPQGSSADDDETKGADICIGLSGEWSDMVGALMRETLELTFGRLKYRYTPKDKPAYHLGKFPFIMTHDEFKGSVQLVAPFVAEALPKLREVWEDMA